MTVARAGSLSWAHQSASSDLASFSFALSGGVKNLKGRRHFIRVPMVR
jgi:hypothetical protein